METELCVRQCGVCAGAGASEFESQVRCFPEQVTHASLSFLFLEDKALLGGFSET